MADGASIQGELRLQHGADRAQPAGGPRAARTPARRPRVRLSPLLTEAEYLSGSIRRTLAGASTGARQAALASIIGGLRPDELSDIEDLARRARDARR